MKPDDMGNNWSTLTARTTRNKAPAQKSTAAPAKDKIPAYVRYLSAKVKRLELAAWTPEIVAEMQTAFLAALQSRKPMPEEMRHELLFAFKEVCAGISSPLLTPVPKGGGRQDPIGKVLQADAVRYLRWVKRRKISDHSPIATVVDAFGVSRRAVQGWQRAWKEEELPPIRRPLLRNASFVTALMRASGKAYRQFIRPEDNAGAVSARDEAPSDVKLTPPL